MDDYWCPICGFGEIDPPYDDKGEATFVICPCCGVEFGYDDFAGMKAMPPEEWHEKMRRRWIAGGMRWWSSTPPPKGWDPVAQLARLMKGEDSRQS